MISTIHDSWKNQTSTSTIRLLDTTIQLLDTTMSLIPLMIQLLA